MDRRDSRAQSIGRLAAGRSTRCVSCSCLKLSAQSLEAGCVGESTVALRRWSSMHLLRWPMARTLFPHSALSTP